MTVTDSVVSQEVILRNCWEIDKLRDEAIVTLFHRLWGKAKDSPDYDKREWQNLQLFFNSKGVKV